MRSERHQLPDPIREVLVLKRWVQVGVYLAVTLPLPLYYYLLAFNVVQLSAWYGVGLVIATAAIEGAFWQMMRLRKQSAYPNILALELGSVQDLRQACDLALRLACHYLKSEAALLAWLDASQRLVPAAVYGMPDDWTRRLQPPGPDHRPIQTVLEERRAVWGRPSECPCWSGLFDDDHVAAYIPLVSLDRVTGIISLVGPRAVSDLRDRKLLESIGMVIGLTLENLRLGNREYQSIMQVLCSALDIRDSATEGHSRRVARMAVSVAQRMELPNPEIKVIERAASLHDIGKIGVPDAVLSKAGPLTSDEWVEMRRHPRLGYEIVADIEALQHAAEIIHCHHERYDGRGYPRGLKGKEIPIGARIFAVVDSYDAMTSHRPYRRARPHEDAIEEIMRNSGTQFDPAAVQAFLEVAHAGLIVPHDSPDAANLVADAHPLAARAGSDTEVPL